MRAAKFDSILFGGATPLFGRVLEDETPLYFSVKAVHAPAMGDRPKVMERNKPERTAPTRASTRRGWRRTYYDILGVPIGAGIDHIKDSYRLLTLKTVITDVAYRTLTDPLKRREYSAWLLEDSRSETHEQIQRTQESQDWGSRGRERCSCGKILKIDDEWHCQECWGKLEYYVVFDMFGGYILHDSQMPVVTEADGQTYWQVPYGSLLGPFPKEEAEAVLKEKNEMREKE